MPQKSKPLSLVQGHLTSAERTARAQGEAALKTDEKMKPSAVVRKNAQAMKYFRRMAKLYAGIDMDEAFYENTLSRYCLLLAEHDEALKDRERIERNIEKLEEHENEMEFKDYVYLAQSLEASLLSADRVLAKRRDQLLSIEKENLMTIQGKMRAVPKKPQADEPSGIAAYMNRRKNG